MSSPIALSNAGARAHRAIWGKGSQPYLVSGFKPWGFAPRSCTRRSHPAPADPRQKRKVSFSRPEHSPK